MNYVRVIAEAGQCHEGSADEAQRLVIAAEMAGCWGVKFQHLRPERIARADAPKYWTDEQGTSNQREAFTTAGVIPYDDPAWWRIKATADDAGIEFISTPFDLEAVAALERLGVRWYKIASGDITYKRLIKAVAATGKKVLLSTGAATQDEVGRALGWLRGGGAREVVVLACTLCYPTAEVDANLARIETLRSAFSSHAVVKGIGYSDHTLGVDTALAAAAMGASYLEKHFTRLPKSTKVPDHAMALDPMAMVYYVRNASLGADLRGGGSLQPRDCELPARLGARRSLVAARPIRRGELFERDDFEALRPGDGVSPANEQSLLGRIATRDYATGDPI